MEIAKGVPAHKYLDLNLGPNDEDDWHFEDSPERVVFVRAIGIKERNNVRVGREVIKL
jgi:hypothetical protein